MKFRSLKNLYILAKKEYGGYYWHIVLLGGLSFIGGILEGFGITAVIPVFSSLPLTLHIKIFANFCYIFIYI